MNAGRWDEMMLIVHISPGGFHLFLFGLIMPALALVTRQRLKHGLTGSRLNLYAAQLIQMVLLTAISIYVARREGIQLFPTAAPPLLAIGLGLAFLAAQFALGYPLAVQAVRERHPIVAVLIPSTGMERVLWIFIAAMAGFGEEISWRGVQTALLSRYTGLLAACAIAVIMFAAAHAVQSARSVAAIALFAVSFHVLVWVSGSLYVAMVEHFIYDAVIGFVYAHLARTMGYATEAAPAIPLTPSDPA